MFQPPITAHAKHSCPACGVEPYWNPTKQALMCPLESMCGAQVPGDTHCNLQVQTNYSKQTFKHILAPVWLLTYNYGPRTYHVVVNSYSGMISGDYPRAGQRSSLRCCSLYCSRAFSFFWQNDRRTIVSTLELSQGIRPFDSANATLRVSGRKNCEKKCRSS